MAGETAAADTRRPMAGATSPLQWRTAFAPCVLGAAAASRSTDPPSPEAHRRIRVTDCRVASPATPSASICLVCILCLASPPSFVVAAGRAGATASARYAPAAPSCLPRIHAPAFRRALRRQQARIRSLRHRIRFPHRRTPLRRHPPSRFSPRLRPPRLRLRPVHPALSTHLRVFLYCSADTTGSASSSPAPEPALRQCRLGSGLSAAGSGSIGLGSSAAAAASVLGSSIATEIVLISPFLARPDCPTATPGRLPQLPSSQLLIKEPNMQTNVIEDTTIGEKCSALLLRGQGLQTFETPLALMCPQVLDSSPHHGYEDAHRTSGVQHAADQKYKGVSVAPERNMADACSSQAIVNSEGFSTNFEVALSNSGTGKLSFTYNSSLANHSDFRMPDMESICKEMEARCLRTYKILEPNFSFMNLLEDTCQCIVNLGFESSGPREKGVVQIVPAVDFLSKPSVPQILQSNQAGSSCMQPNNLMRLGGICSSSAVAGVSQNSSSNMQVIQQQLTIGAKRPPHDVNDITKGEERVSIPIVNGVGNGILPPPFHYIPCNITFQNAYINLSLARIGDGNCCSDCFGDCLAQPLPCACATETGGEFAYTRDGLLKEAFLDSCVSMLREPHKHPHFYCKICPHERMKIEVNSDLPNTEANPDPCKGHLIRKFIKECWSKCGCTRNCGNRVVQRGITRHLQVFLTPGKKGWGLRTADKLPRGAFVCEYVGEILTNIELYERTIQKTGKAKHTYPLLLDADWGTEGFLKDEEALCLDGTFYGNAARFINHRCFDANIIGIPVEIETPDHHYYHLAFFTTRQIEPFEELTWDYGIDFDDVNHPVKAFKCSCASKLCRDKRCISRSKSRTLVLL